LDVHLNPAVRVVGGHTEGLVNRTADCRNLGNFARKKELSRCYVAPTVVPDQELTHFPNRVQDGAWQYLSTFGMEREADAFPHHPPFKPRAN
jgi:hypothetical protein